jgi:uncharacterized membrane protein
MLSFLTPYFGWIKVAAVAILFAVGVGIGVHLEQGKIDTLNQEVGEYKTAYTSLANTTAEQNAAIASLNEQSAEREKIAAAAQEQAKEAVKLAQRRSTAILKQTRPTGVNLCDAASKAFDDELKLERGVK